MCAGVSIPYPVGSIASQPVPLLPNPHVAWCILLHPCCGTADVAGLRKTQRKSKAIRNKPSPEQTRMWAGQRELRDGAMEAPQFPHRSRVRYVHTLHGHKDEACFIYHHTTGRAVPCRLQAHHGCLPHLVAWPRLHTMARNWIATNNQHVNRTQRPGRGASIPRQQSHARARNCLCCHQDGPLVGNWNRQSPLHPASQLGGKAPSEDTPHAKISTQQLLCIICTHAVVQLLWINPLYNPQGTKNKAVDM